MESKVLLALSLAAAALISLPGAGIGVETWAKTWTIAAGHDWGAHEYIDTDGYIRGFTRDLIAAVCEAGNMQCRTVWDKYTNCWDSEAGQLPFGGVGLMGGWYDVCMSYVGTVSRTQVFDFSLPFFKPGEVFLHVIKGKPFDVYNIANVKAIGFVDGWSMDEYCLARQTMITGSALPPEKIKHYPGIPQMISALKSGEIDAIFATKFWDDSSIVTAGNTFFTCSATGNAMMTRKDNDFNNYWNMGFQQLVASGRFAQLCEDSAVAHANEGAISACV